ncbi:hypothetical protein CI238_13440 [Colletotrichum incanum]|uniref:Uncharacterized protein n=1 Tax=Colletotrichum incanum TaxID=1573173 RepID=A0A162NWV7_COLIC|nr:hypothetical protein CI238_13440 [Colletotrichum incanum]
MLSDPEILKDADRDNTEPARPWDL